MRQHCGQNVPIILLGTKSDLKEDPTALAELGKEGKSPIKYVDGLKLQRKINAVKYMECSAKTLINIHEVFETAIRSVIDVKPERNRKKHFCCAIL